jgi:spermidine synthase
VRLIFQIVFFASGFAALGYQIVWAKLFAAGLGHEIPSVLATISALFFGMAAGAYSIDRLPLQTRNPCRIYASLELIIALWGGVSALLLPEVNQLVLKLIGLEPSLLKHWFLAFAIPCLALLPATAAMGATFPIMFRVASEPARNKNLIGGIYSANTFGAVAGVLITAFILLPAIPLPASLLFFAAINLVVSLVLFSCRNALAESPEPNIGQCNSPRGQGIQLFALGFLGLGFELWGTRMLSQILENTIYTYATILAVFLTALAAGAFCFQSFRKYIPATFNQLVLLLAASLLIFSLPIVFAEAEYSWLRHLFGDHRISVMLAEFLSGATIFAVPGLLMGFIYSEVMQRIADKGDSLGDASAANTLGGAFAAPFWVVLLLPVIGSKWVLILMVSGYVLLAQIRTLNRLLIVAALSVFALFLPLNYSFFQETSGAAFLHEGVMATVTVRSDNVGRRSLYVNHRFQMGGTGSTPAEQRHADIPLLLRPGAQRALFLGLGTGISIGAARFHEDLTVDGVELLPGVLAALPHFAPENGDPQKLSNFRFYAADARRFVRCTEERYDVIVADLFNPAHDGIGLLYSEEHFRAVKLRLNPGGLFCQWLPLYQMDSQTLRSIMATFVKVFEDAGAFLLRFNVDTPVLGLMSDSSHGLIPSASFPSAPILTEHLRQIGLADPLRLWGNYLCGTDEIKRFAGKAPLNTDAFPHLIFDAPIYTYNQKMPPYATLTNLLAQIPVSLPGRAAAAGTAFNASLRDFMVARNQYLEGLVCESEGREKDAVDRYIKSSTISSDFTQGYARCLTIASGIASSDAQAAADLLKRLIKAQPERVLGKEMLERLGSRPARP